MIAVDWGSSSLRAYRVDVTGAVVEQRRSDHGVLTCGGNFAGALASLIGAWNDAHIVLCGMIGSRNGWFEQPYLDCPVGVEELAAGTSQIAVPEFVERRLWFMPGVCDRISSEVPDVMRGEEAQVCGLLDALHSGTHVLCLPGTHSKWITVRDGRITALATAMTGEAYAVLRKHRGLGKLLGSGDSRFDAYAFDTGLQRSAEAGGLLHHLFGVRTLGLFGKFSETALPSYLSGLLIGHELHAAGLLTRTPRPAQVHLIGNDRLLVAYARALRTLGIGVQRHPEDLAARGMHCLARSLGVD